MEQNVRGYIMWHKSQHFLVFGQDAVEAAKIIEKQGIPMDQISVSRSFDIKDQSGFRITGLEIGGVLLQDLEN